MARWIVFIVALWSLVIEPTFGLNEWMAASACSGQREPNDPSEEPLGGWDAWTDQTLPQQDDHEVFTKAVQPVPTLTPVEWEGWNPALPTTCVQWYAPPPILAAAYPPSDLPLRV